MRESYGETDFAKQELDGDFVSFNAGFFPTKHILFEKGLNIVNVVHAWDLGFTDKKNSDYTGYALCGIDNLGRFVVIHSQRWKFKAPIVKQLIKDRLKELDAPCLIEANGAQVAVYDDLIADKELFHNTLIPIKTTTSKPSRSVGLASAMSQGNVVFVKNEWNQELVDEMDSFTIDSLKITPIRINHIVPTVSYLIEEGDKQFLYVGDMHHTDSLWEEVNKLATNLKGIIIETSFPNKLDWLAKTSGHLTPKQLEEEIKKLKTPVPLYIFHMKPMFIEELVEEVYSIKYPERIKILNQEDILEI